MKMIIYINKCCDNMLELFGICRKLKFRKELILTNEYHSGLVVSLKVRSPRLDFWVSVKSYLSQSKNMALSQFVIQNCPIDGQLPIALWVGERAGDFFLKNIC